MKILVCHNAYQQPGGEEVAVELQVELLRSRGHQVVLYQRHSRELLDYGLLEKARFPLETVASRRTTREIRALVTRERPALAHVHNVFPLLSPSLYSALADAGVPIVQTVHNYRLLCPNGLFYTRGQVCERCKHGATHHAVRLRCYRSSYTLSAVYALAIGRHRRRGTFDRIDRFVALTSFTADKLVEGGLAPRDKVSVLGNFLPSPLPEPARAAPGGPAGGGYVLYLGRLSGEKGVHLLVEAFAGLPSVALKIAGSGPEADALARRIESLGARNVELIGRREGAEKWTLIRDALFTVAPSLWYECFPFAVLESLACGVPALVAGHGGLAAMLAGREVAMTFRPGDAADLRARAAELAVDPARRRQLGERGRALVESEFSDHAHYRRLTGIYRELVP